MIAPVAHQSAVKTGPGILERVVRQLLQKPFNEGVGMKHRIELVAGNGAKQPVVGHQGRGIEPLCAIKSQLGHGRLGVVVEQGIHLHQFNGIGWWCRTRRPQGQT